MKLRHLDGLIALHDIELVQLLLRVALLVVQGVVGFDDAGGYLDERILSNEGIHDGLEYIRGFRLGEIVVRLEDLVGLHIDSVAGLLVRAREQLHDIVHQVVDIADLGAGSHGYRNDVAVAHVELHGRADLAEGKLFAVEIALHEFLGRLRHRVHQGLAADGQVILGILRDRAGLALSDIRKAAAFHLAHIDIAHKFLILTDRHIERSNLLSIQIRQILHHLAEGRMVHVHLGHEDHSRQLVLIAELPGLLGAYLHACLSGYDDDRRVRRGHSLLRLAYKVEIARGVQKVDLAALPDDRNHRCGNGEFSLNLFLIIIADRVPVSHLADTGSQPGHIRHRFHQTGLAAPTVAQKNYIANLVSCVNVHASSSDYLILRSLKPPSPEFTTPSGKAVRSPWLYSTKIQNKVQVFYADLTSFPLHFCAIFLCFPIFCTFLRSSLVPGISFCTFSL